MIFISDFPAHQLLDGMLLVFIIIFSFTVLTMDNLELVQKWVLVITLLLHIAEDCLMDFLQMPCPKDVILIEKKNIQSKHAMNSLN